MQTFEILGGNAKCKQSIARLLCLIPYWRALIVSCYQLQLEWTEPGWWLGLYLLAIVHPETTLRVQETVPNCVFNVRSIQDLQFNQIQCGKVTGATSPSTLAFTKMIKVDLSPAWVDSSARTFILLLLSMILVKLFLICEDTQPIVSTATVVLSKTNPMSMELPSWRSIKLSKFVEGLLFFAM